MSGRLSATTQLYSFSRSTTSSPSPCPFHHNASPLPSFFLKPPVQDTCERINNTPTLTASQTTFPPADSIHSLASFLAHFSMSRPLLSLPQALCRDYMASLSRRSWTTTQSRSLYLGYSEMYPVVFSHSKSHS